MLEIQLLKGNPARVKHFKIYLQARFRAAVIDRCIQQNSKSPPI